LDSTYAAAYPDLYRQHWWWRVRESILLAKLGELLGERAKPARILDVGCGAGLFFDALQRFGHVEGIEADESAVQAAGKWRASIFAGELDGSFKPAAPYDTILMLDILEHVPNPEVVLRHARALLKPNGQILITVPAFNWLWTTHDDLNQHFRRYTAAQMRRTVTTAGLAVNETTYLFQSLVLPKAVVRLQERLVATSAHVPSIPGPKLNRALQVWFRAEHALASRLPFGTSLMVVAGLPS
jgi:2-polyprenyl-3-methyl-5-hydroxy-6-metoxy-1,4-benzoquinol methylase